MNAIAGQSPGAEPVLALSGVTKHFGGLRAISAVTLDVGAREVVGLIGPNGAGKTTLLNIISGLVRPDAGTVHLNGQDATRWPAHRIAAEGRISRTFQNIRMFQGMTVIENVLTGYHARMSVGLLAHATLSRAHRRQEKEARERAQAQLEQLGLADYMYRTGSELSYGIQRRVEIARALVSEPRILLLDEPTAGMTPRETNEVMGLIHDLRKRDLSMIVIEHKAGFIMGVSDRVAVLNFGNVIANGPADRVRTDPQVIEAYLGADHENA